MKFSEIKYQRPPLAEILTEIDSLAQKVKNAKTSSEALAAFEQFNAIENSFETALNIAYIRHTINTKDEFYDKEQEFFDNNIPYVVDKAQAFYNAMLESEHRAEMEKVLGKLIFEKIELEIKAQSSEIVPLMQQENVLVTRYAKLCATAQIDFDGKKLTLSELASYKQSLERSTRRAAYEAEGKWFDENMTQLDEIFDALVINRTEQAHKMGFDSFVSLAYIRRQRLGYGEAEVAAFRDEIVRSIVPAVTKIKNRQKAELDVSEFMLWDILCYFKDGNAAPKGTAGEILKSGLEMYENLSPETADFMQKMMKSELFDVISREGKAPGGYCATIPDYKMPFIYSNFNGTSDDVDVLTHEAGHAFAAHIALKKNLPSLLRSPAYESCEIHSMAMEFLTSDYHHLFFGDDTEKYEYFHTADALTFLPYGTMVDEFQHIIYKNPAFSHKERNDAWAKLEKKYRPWLNFGDVPCYSRGAGWQRQRHIYEMPFYYIDYCLAQSVALQFYAAFLSDKKEAWQRYLQLVNKAGTETYTGLVEAAGFEPPFKQGALERVAKAVSEKLGL